MTLPTFRAETLRAMRIKTELLDFVEQESKKAGKDERLLGTSEIIESVLGKMKRLEHDQAKIGKSVQAKRVQVNGLIKGKEQKQKQNPVLEMVCRFGCW